MIIYVGPFQYMADDKNTRYKILLINFYLYFLHPQNNVEDKENDKLTMNKFNVFLKFANLVLFIYICIIHLTS